MTDEAPKKRGVGRPAFNPTDEMRRDVVVRMSCGMPPEWIAKFIGCGEKTLRRHFAGELERGKQEGVALQAGRVFARGLREDFVGQKASEFWLKCVGGWKETIKVEDTPQTLIVQILAGDTVLL